MSKKILVVDDDEGILDALEVMLTSVGYAVELSLDGEVLEHFDNKALPDLILLDMLLSGKDGRTLCRLVKDKPETKKIPVIMLSAHPNAAKAVKACGADEFVAKPFSMDEIITKIEKYTS